MMKCHTLQTTERIYILAVWSPGFTALSDCIMRATKDFTRQEKSRTALREHFELYFLLQQVNQGE